MMNTKAEIRIYKAFLALYRQKTIREMSVKEICLNAHVSRVTFYTYFEDINTLLNEIENKIIAVADEIFKTWSYIDLTKLDKYKPIPILVDYYTYIYNNLDIFRTLYGPHADPHFFDRCYDYARKSFLDAVKLCRITTFTPKILATMCIDGLESMERLWILGKIKATPSEFALLIQNIMIAIIGCDIKQAP
jgi:AcrR family transcriptional regulator